MENIYDHLAIAYGHKHLSLNPPRIPRSSAAWVELAAVGNGGTMRTWK